MSPASNAPESNYKVPREADGKSEKGVRFAGRAKEQDLDGAEVERGWWNRGGNVLSGVAVGKNSDDMVRASSE